MDARKGADRPGNRILFARCVREVSAADRRLCRVREIVAVTGAGISVASGLPTLEAAMRGRPLREMFRSDMAQRHVREYQQFYEKMTREWRNAKPNAAHRALADRRVRVVTQNVDGLHQRAGSRDVIELHGALHRVRCSGCRTPLPVRSPAAAKPRCASCGGLLWPDLVWEGEPVHGWLQAQNWVSAADLLLVVGTRLAMAPVRQLPAVARQAGAPVLLVNREAESLLPDLLEV